MTEYIKEKISSLEIKQQNNLKALIVILPLFLIIIGIVHSIKGDEKKDISKLTPEYEISEEKVSVEDVWLQRSEEKISEITNQLSEESRKNKRLEEQLLRIEERMQELVSNNEFNKSELLGEIEIIKRKKTNPTSKKNQEEIQNDPYVFQDSFQRGGVVQNSYFSGDKNSSPGAVPNAREIEVVNFSADEKFNSFDVSEYIPPGSYVQAILISAVDAAVGLSSQSNPRPVLFKLTSTAKSATQGKKQLDIDIKGCVVTGAASGDLSSERAYVRLLKMTCSKNGKAIVTDIEGHASDASDGKAGIAGKVVTRDGDYITKSFFSGALEGLGNGISERLDPQINFQDGFATGQVRSSSQIAKSGLSSGISNSASQISKFMIDRAKQYEPVISIASGKEVELVFQSGAYLDGRVVQEQNNDNNKIN